VAKRSKTSDWEPRSEVVGLIPNHASNFTSSDCKKINNASIVRVMLNLQWLLYRYDSSMSSEIVKFGLYLNRKIHNHLISIRSNVNKQKISHWFYNSVINSRWRIYNALVTPRCQFVMFKVKEYMQNPLENKQKGSITYKILSRAMKATDWEQKSQIVGLNLAHASN